MLAACLLLTACSRQETAAPRDAQSDTATQVAQLLLQRDAITAGKDSLDTANATWELDGATSTVRGYYSGGSLSLIEEEMTMGEFGSARSHYFYTPQGHLFAYTEAKDSQSGVRTGNARTQRISLHLFYGPNGNLLQGERTVDGDNAPLTGLESQGVKMHARELELLLLQKRPAPPK